MRATTVCPQCPNLMPCPVHRRIPWPNSTRRTQLPKGWDKLRVRILKRDPICQVCGTALATQVDHIDPDGTHLPTNLQGICVRCHRAKTAQEGHQARNGGPILEYPYDHAPTLIALVGAVGAGKTHLAHHLGMPYPYRSIDECGPRGHRAERWASMFRWIHEQQGCAMTESNVIPPPYSRLLGRTPHLAIEVVAPDTVRRKRVDNRGDLGWDITQHPVGHPTHLTVTGDPQGLAQATALIDQWDGGTPLPPKETYRGH